MKNLLSDKFKNKVKFVRPLYRKAKVRPKQLAFISFDQDGKNLAGDGKVVKNKTKVTLVKSKSVSNQSVAYDHGGNKFEQKSVKQNRVIVNNNMNGNFNGGDGKMLKINGGNDEDEKVDTDHKEVQACDKNLVVHTLPDSWLRVYPVPTHAGESTGSIVFRFAFCQLGLIAVLIIWTLIWSYLIYCFEGPYELEISIDFEKRQNQLVIDLATELRQITPLSTRWREAIEKRIGEERLLTVNAVARGAKLNPGRFWDPSGTFLFIIYVMTAFVVNASTCLVIKLENYVKKIRNHGALTQKSKQDSNQVIEETKPSTGHKIIKCFINSLVMFYGIPQFVILYYAIGALSFGVARHKDPWDTVMFPMEFTTSGGLAQIDDYVRLVYGLYVEGAMILVACILAMFRRHSNATRTYLCNKYNLFATEKCGQCNE